MYKDIIINTLHVDYLYIACRLKKRKCDRKYEVFLKPMRGPLSFLVTKYRNCLRCNQVYQDLTSSRPKPPGCRKYLISPKYMYTIATKFVQNDRQISHWCISFVNYSIFKVRSRIKRSSAVGKRIQQSGFNEQITHSTSVLTRPRPCGIPARKTEMAQ